MPASDLLLLSMSSQQVRIAAKSIQRVAFVHVKSVSNGPLKLYLEYSNGQKVPILSLSGDMLYMSPSWYYKIGGQDVEMKLVGGSSKNSKILPGIRKFKNFGENSKNQKFGGSSN